MSRRIFPSTPHRPRKPGPMFPCTSTPKKKPGTRSRTSIRSRAPELRISSALTAVTTAGESVSRVMAKDATWLWTSSSGGAASAPAAGGAAFASSAARDGPAPASPSSNSKGTPARSARSPRPTLCMVPLAFPADAGPSADANRGARPRDDVDGHLALHRALHPHLHPRLPGGQTAGGHRREAVGVVVDPDLPVERRGADLQV